MKKKLLALLLMLLLITPSILACSDSGTNQETTDENITSSPSVSEETVSEESDTSPASEETILEESNTTLYNDIPNGNYDGYTFSILNPSSNYAYVLMTAEDLSGETINDAVFNRNIVVGDKLNVKFTEEIVPHAEVAGMVTRMVASDTPHYDIVFEEVQNCVKYPANGQVIDLNTMKELNFSKPWWDKGSVEALTIGNNLYMVNGDLHLMYGESAWVLFFNQNMLNEYNLESPYSIIKEGRWTFDKMHEMITGIAKDLDGNGILDSDDQFGLATHSDFSLVMLVSAGEGLLYKNESNIPEWTNLSEKVFNIAQKTHEQFFDLNNVFQWYLSPKGSDTKDIIPHFMAGKSLFLSEVLGHTKVLRDMENDFGIIPTPKYDETQENYNTFVSRTAQSLMVPVTNRDLSRTAVILENLGAESFKSLRPAYYDIQLSGKIARDADSIEMLDIIFEGRRYETAYIFGANTVGSTYISSVETGGELSSSVAKISKALRKNIENTVKDLTKAE